MDHAVHKMRGRPDLELRLWIDDQPLSVSAVQFLYQDMARPGGHDYRFIVEGPDALTETELAANQTKRSLGRREASRLMHNLDWLIPKVADVPRRCDYFINTIDEVDTRNGEIVIVGKCSAAGATP